MRRDKEAITILALSITIIIIVIVLVTPIIIILTAIITITMIIIAGRMDGDHPLLSAATRRDATRWGRSTMRTTK